MTTLTWKSWRTGRAGFTLWHRFYDWEHLTVCGRKPDGIVSTRMQAPTVTEECRVCRERDPYQRKAS